MPPANSPSDTPVPRSPPTPNVPYLPQLHELETPVPDLASTLGVRAGEDDVEALRTHTSSIRDQMDSRPARRRGSLSRAPEDDPDPRVALAARARRIGSSAFERASAGRRMNEASDGRSYGDRLPRWQSLYDWAPAGEEGRESGRTDHRRGTGTSTTARGSSPSASVNVPQLWLSSTPPPLRSLHSSGLPSSDRPNHPQSTTPTTTSTHHASHRGYHSMDGRRPLMPPSQASHGSSDLSPSRLPQYSDLRSQAIAQSIRRHPLSQRSRAEEETREQLRQARLLRPPSMVTLGERRQQSANRDLGSIVDTYRQRYLQDPSGPSPPARSGSLEDVIQYLDCVRYSPSGNYARCLALDHHLVRATLLEMHTGDDDFLFDVADVKRPPPTSWLAAGSVFEGSQHATRSRATITRRVSSAHDSILSDPSSEFAVQPWSARSANAVQPPSADQPTTFTILDPVTTDHAGRTSDHGSSRSNKREDKWPVRVTIHAVDYAEMRLSGEMEAFNVPDGRSPDGKSSIKTYLEGEIIDFHTHALETKNFFSSAKTDGTYWKKLMPFRACMDDDHLARCLLSKRWLAEHISREWVLLRLKEKHFLHPADQRLGLTISGFYYVSLRRSDGFVEGLYYDPNSSPYQHLVLRPPGNLDCGGGDGYEDMDVFSCDRTRQAGGRRSAFPVYQFR